MSTLTKVFIVVLAVFSVAFATMTISIVAQTANWRDTALKYEEHARVADTNLRNMIAASAAELATARDSVRSHLEKIGELEAGVKAASAESARMRSELAKAESEKSSAEAMNRGLLAQLQIAESARGEYKKQRDDIERRNIELERRNFDLNDRVNEQTVKIDVLLNQRREFERQINVLRAEAEKGGRGTVAGIEEPQGVALPNIVALAPVPARTIRGRITELKGNLVMLSVGNADGVQPEMLFTIHRDGQYVGDVKIQKVDPNQSAGSLVRTAENMRPQTGDQVTDSASLAGAGSR